MVRFADRPEIEVATDVDATPEDVWPYVIDINTSAKFQDEFQEAEWIDAGPALGAQFRGTNRRGDREWETTSTIVEYDPNRRFTWAVGDTNRPLATWSMRIDPLEQGSRLTFYRNLGPGDSGLTAAIARRPEREEEIVAYRQETHRRHMTAVIEGIKSLVEA